MTILTITWIALSCILILYSVINELFLHKLHRFIHFLLYYLIFGSGFAVAIYEDRSLYYLMWMLFMTVYNIVMMCFNIDGYVFTRKCRKQDKELQEQIRLNIIKYETNIRKI